MKGDEFLTYINKFPSIKQYFDGVFSLDLMPNSLKLRHFCLCNFDLSSGKGTHWYIILRYDNSSYELFDSLGLNDDKKSLLKKYCKIKKDLIFNKTQFQRNDSDSCGYFCLYFIIERLHNYDLDFNDLLSNIFNSENLDANERQVSLFIEDIRKDFHDGS